MNYQRTKPASTRTAKIIVAVAVILIFLRLVIPHAFAAFFTDVFSPFWRLENFIVRTVDPEKQIVFSSDSPFASSTVAELLQENIDLKNMLGRATTPNAVVAAVLSKPPFVAYDTLIVDAGSNQGVVAGDKVYALADPVVYSTSSDLPPAVSTTTSSSPQSVIITTKNHTKSGLSQSVANFVSASSSSTLPATSSIPTNPQIEIPIGQITVTYTNTSVITLFTSPGQTYPVQIGSYHISATATAEGSGMFEAMIPNNSNVVVGDPVLIPSIQTGVFASVVSIVSDPARPYSTVLFQSPVDPFSLYLVEIENNVINHATK